MWISTRNMLCR